MPAARSWQNVRDRPAVAIRSTRKWFDAKSDDVDLIDVRDISNRQELIDVVVKAGLAPESVWSAPQDLCSIHWV
jgi:hypothetical protein